MKRLQFMIIVITRILVIFHIYSQFFYKILLIIIFNYKKLTLYIILI